MKKFVKEITKKSEQIEIEGLTQCLYQLIQQTWNPEQHINNSYNYNFDVLNLSLLFLFSFCFLQS